MNSSLFNRRVSRLAAAAGLPQERTAELVTKLLEQIADDALRGSRVRTPIGVFRKSTTKARLVRNQATGELMQLKPSFRLAFRPAVGLKGMR